MGRTKEILIALRERELIQEESWEQLDQFLNIKHLRTYRQIRTETKLPTQ